MRIAIRESGLVPESRLGRRSVGERLTLLEDHEMCRLCDEGSPQDHSSSRRNFLKTAAMAGVTATAFDLLAAGPAAANEDREPEDSGGHGRRYLIRGGAVMSMDPQVGDFPQA